MKAQSVLYNYTIVLNLENLEITSMQFKFLKLIPPIHNLFWQVLPSATTPLPHVLKINSNFPQKIFREPKFFDPKRPVCLSRFITATKHIVIFGTKIIIPFLIPLGVFDLFLFF